MDDAKKKKLQAEIRAAMIQAFEDELLNFPKFSDDEKATLEQAAEEYRKGLILEGTETVESPFDGVAVYQDQGAVCFGLYIEGVESLVRKEAGSGKVYPVALYTTYIATRQGWRTEGLSMVACLEMQTHGTSGAVTSDDLAEVAYKLVEAKAKPSEFGDEEIPAFTCPAPRGKN